ncbi:MAG: SCP2 sterol-binding domain-containing protein [Myxococcota bacterium]
MSGPQPMLPVPRGPLEIFCVHVGSFVAVAIYFAVLGSASDREAGVRVALPIAWAVMTVYLLSAHRLHLLKQFDVGLWSMFAVGTAAVLAGFESIGRLFATYGSAIVFLTLALVAWIPLLLGREPFTVFFARRGTPAWQQQTRDFVILNRIITLWFALLFSTAAGLAAWEPDDVHFAVVYPNLLVFVAGLPSPRWIPPLYLRLVGPRPPDTAEAAILGMPLAFDAKVADDARATVQFHLSGPEGGDFWLRVADRTCESAEGRVPGADLVIRAPSSLWLGIARGEIDPARALLDGRCSVEGDGSILADLGEWFPRSS